ncbi:MAG: PPC domain-containing protein [Spirochaetaceae bacterium]|jgi:hypothetical protein|nr:PPC domain-containing protein [Spirochaetaceae bacterium]
MAHKKHIFAAALLVCLLGHPLVSQERPETLGDMDRITDALVTRLYLRLRTLARGSEPFSLALGRFSVQGEESPLGDLLRSNLQGALANLEARPYVIIDTPPAATAGGDYLISADILDVGNAVRVAVRLVKTEDSSIIAAWHSDFEKTPWIAALLEQPGRTEGGGTRRDAHEPDSQENPVPAEIGGPWISRTIHAADDRDWFLIVSPVTVMLTAETSGSLDTMMELYNEEGTRVASDDDGGEDTNARITFNAEAGKRYVAMIRGYSSHTGAYRFQVFPETIADEAVEPNNTREQATAITLNEESGFRAFLFSGDEDWYRAEVPSGGALVTVYTEGALDTFLTIYDANGGRLAEDDDSGDGNNARVTVNLPEGAFYIKASLYSGSSSRGVYTLFTRVREPAAQDAYEPDNQLSQAKDIEVGQNQTRNFTGAADIDWARIRITQAGRYGIRARGASGTEQDTYLELLDSSEEVIAEDDDSGDTYDAYISVDLQPGTYYIKVSTLDRDPAGNYVLSVTRE